jgi:hypothetical protein
MIGLMIESLTIGDRGRWTTRTSQLAALSFALLCPLTASAQERRPLPVAVFEVRGVTGSLMDDPVTAGDLGLAGGVLPGRASGGVAGLHFYPLRGPGLALGVGGEGLLARGRSAFVDAAGEPTGDHVVRQLQGLSGIVSLNFGHEDGWSHISAGVGPLRFRNALAPAVALPPPATNAAYLLTLNAGGGARWFLSDHVAFGFDVRMYFTRAEAQTGGSAGREAARLLLLSAGVTIK